MDALSVLINNFVDEIALQIKTGRPEGKKMNINKKERNNDYEQEVFYDGSRCRLSCVR